MALNDFALNGNQLDGSVTTESGEGAIIAFEQDLQYYFAGGGSIIGIEQNVQTIGSGAIFGIGQTVIIA